MTIAMKAPSNDDGSGCFELPLEDQRPRQRGLGESSLHSTGSASMNQYERALEEEEDAGRILNTLTRNNNASMGVGEDRRPGVHLPSLQSLAHRSHPLQYSKQHLNQGNPSEPPPQSADDTVCRPDTPSQLQAAQRAGMAARERFDLLANSSHLPGDHASNLLLLSWDEIFVEELLGMGGFACVCLVTCDTLWRKHKRHYLQRKWNNSQHQNSGDLDSVDSSLLPPSEDSWMSMSVDTNEEKYYACKCLSNATIQSRNHNHFANAAADLVGEAFLLSKLSHPNIIRLYGVTGGPVDRAFQETGGFFLVMEALTSVLDDMIQVWRKDSVSSVGDFLLKSNESVPNMDERLTIAMEVAEGMQYLHSNRIIFRDLKPHNVGIDREGGVRLFDFGLARECPSGVCSGKAGSLRYMAPETFTSKFCCFGSDVYAFGITMWELVSLVRPTKFSCPEEVELAICEQGYRPDTGCIEDPAVRQLMDACWHQDYQQRPTFARIIASLHNILDNNRRQRIMERRARRNPSRNNSSMDIGSNHSLGRDSGHSLGSFTQFEASFQSLMNDSVMTDASFSKVSALTMGSGRAGRQRKRGAVLPVRERSKPPPPPQSASMAMSPPPSRHPNRPPKTLQKAPPSKNESETTITVSNISSHYSVSRSAGSNKGPPSAISIGHAPQYPVNVFSIESVGRRSSGNAERDFGDDSGIAHERSPSLGHFPRPPTKKDSISTTNSAPASIMSGESPQVTGHCGSPEESSGHSRRSTGSDSSGSSNGSGNGPIQWKRKKKPVRQPKGPRSKQNPRSQSEPLSSLMDTLTKK